MKKILKITIYALAVLLPCAALFMTAGGIYFYFRVLPNVTRTDPFPELRKAWKLKTLSFSIRGVSMTGADAENLCLEPERGEKLFVRSVKIDFKPGIRKYRASAEIRKIALTGGEVYLVLREDGLQCDALAGLLQNVSAMARENLPQEVMLENFLLHFGTDFSMKFSGKLIPGEEPLLDGKLSCQNFQAALLARIRPLEKTAQIACSGDFPGSVPAVFRIEGHFRNTGTGTGTMQLELAPSALSALPDLRLWQWRKPLSLSGPFSLQNHAGTLQLEFRGSGDFPTVNSGSWQLGGNTLSSRLVWWWDRPKKTFRLRNLSGTISRFAAGDPQLRVSAPQVVFSGTSSGLRFRAQNASVQSLGRYGITDAALDWDFQQGTVTAGNIRDGKKRIGSAVLNWTGTLFSNSALRYSGNCRIEHEMVRDHTIALQGCVWDTANADASWSFAPVRKVFALPCGGTASGTLSGAGKLRCEKGVLCASSSLLLQDGELAFPDRDARLHDVSLAFRRDEDAMTSFQLRGSRAEVGKWRTGRFFLDVQSTGENSSWKLRDGNFRFAGGDVLLLPAVLNAAAESSLQFYAEKISARSLLQDWFQCTLAEELPLSGKGRLKLRKMSVDALDFLLELRENAPERIHLEKGGTLFHSISSRDERAFAAAVLADLKLKTFRWKAEKLPGSEKLGNTILWEGRPLNALPFDYNQETGKIVFNALSVTKFSDLKLEIENSAPLKGGL